MMMERSIHFQNKLNELGIKLNEKGLKFAGKTYAINETDA